MTFPLLSDADLTVHRLYGAYGEKKLYGKVYEASRGLTCRKTMIYCRKSESHRVFSLLLRGRAPRSYETLERLAEEPMFEDIGTLHDHYQEFDIYPLLTLLTSFA